jgi:hypothetical protein
MMLDEVSISGFEHSTVDLKTFLSIMENSSW